MDMLQFFQEKLKIKQGFAELINDIGINKKIFLDDNEEKLETEEEEEVEQIEHALYQDLDDVDMIENIRGEEEMEDDQDNFC